MNKELIKLICKILLYIITAIAGFFGVSSLASCQSSHSVQSSGKAVIISVDTTIVKHGGFIRSKNFQPYE